MAESVSRAARKATRRDGYPDGIADAAEALVEWALDHLRDGARAPAIKDSVGKACRKIADGMDWGSGPSYAASCLRSWKADPARKGGQGDAWKAAPPPTPAGGYHVPTPRPPAEELARRRAESEAAKAKNPKFGNPDAETDR